MFDLILVKISFNSILFFQCVSIHISINLSLGTFFYLYVNLTHNLCVLCVYFVCTLRLDSFDGIGNTFFFFFFWYFGNMAKSRIKNRAKDSRIFRRTATRQRVENIPGKLVPRGGTRH